MRAFALLAVTAMVFAAGCAKKDDNADMNTPPADTTSPAPMPAEPAPSPTPSDTPPPPDATTTPPAAEGTTPPPPAQ
jgi:hypothetical protein